MSGTDNPENNKMLTIDDLPGEVLLEVFSQLSLPVRKSVRLIHKQWNELCSSARFTKHETLRAKNIVGLDQMNISWSIVNVKFYRIHLDATLLLGFWKKHGSRVKSITISESCMKGPVLHDIIGYCPNMEHLSLISSDIESSFTITATCNLENLVKLEVHDRNLHPVTLGLLTRNVPKLKYYSLSAYMPRASNPSILGDVMSLIKKQCDTLETICVSGYSFVNDNLLSSLGDVVGVQLTGLYISNCANVTDDIFETIANKFVNLERLDVSENCMIGLKLDSSVFSRLTKLKLIDLNDTGIKDPVLCAIADLEQIEGIDVSHCHGLTAEGISKALGAKKHETILDIRLANLVCVTDEVLAQILPQLPNLKAIDLSECDELNAKGVSEITSNCKLLRAVAIARGPQIDDNTIIDLNNLKHLLYLDLVTSPPEVEDFPTGTIFELYERNYNRIAHLDYFY